MSNRIVKWYQTDKRPKDGQKIITEGWLGLYWGNYTTIVDGGVYIEGDSSDFERWENIDFWIPYPTE